MVRHRTAEDLKSQEVAFLLQQKSPSAGARGSRTCLDAFPSPGNYYVKKQSTQFSGTPNIACKTNLGDLWVQINSGIVSSRMEVTMRASLTKDMVDSSKSLARVQIRPCPLPPPPGELTGNQCS